MHHYSEGRFTLNGEFVRRMNDSATTKLKRENLINSLSSTIIDHTIGHLLLNFKTRLNL